MSRAVTLFTGQWADLPQDELFPLVKEMGYDGVELACWGDHFDVDQALEDESYIPNLWKKLQEHGLTCHAISNHLVGQAICDPIDDRHKAILSDKIWGDGDPEGVRQRAAEAMKDTARAARKFFDARPDETVIHPVVNGFTGSSIWAALYAFPPTSQEYLNKGYEDFAKRWLPILNVFEEVDVNFALEVHPTEIAFDTASSERALAAVNQHKRFGFNYDPSHLAYQGVDYVQFIRKFSDRIYHAHMKDVWWGHGDGSVGVFGGHTEFTDPRRYWDFRSLGHGDVQFEDIIVALNDIQYAGPLSVEWEDGRMDRVHGGTEAAAFVRKIDFEPNKLAFDAAFDKSNQ
ncbi:sugar phosphate isomerase/epimerase family protein [Puniceicoccus vermicola]|uniref:Sugar phosphate isomerase/epimerase n=1 Tax=Puniceicoccus vermicola TaxID=388746 RepID=A0A7X1B2B5_9BACT|nr:sugar phosphate isomerase/epimerase [Puniceicoccus vermicola]MBC2604331.1 sugar phosphate isomerase/epimerase [Puniceicoccus vermicola]